MSVVQRHAARIVRTLAPLALVAVIAVVEQSGRRWLF
jgi:hypothetical protein